jgi:glutamyl-tRNA synthetase
MLRGRFAPTPSGLIHIGNARTALLAWLQARSAGGAFILRTEDIDEPRSRPDYARRILEDLRWLGLDWDEGPDVGGPHVPYVQSERKELYLDALAKLKKLGMVYPCYCSRTELMAVASAPHGLASEGPAYPGTCRGLTPDEVEMRAKQKSPSLRFAVPEMPLTYRDETAGLQSFPPGSGGDFIVLRADGIFAYQLAVVVDDAAMGVTHVVRGFDLLDSTPRQIWLYEALCLPVPQFAHVPLLFGPDGKRLSKRHGAVTLAAIRETGTSPELLTGFLAYWSGLIERPEPVKPAELVRTFALDRVPRVPVTISGKELQLLASDV